MSQNFEQRPRFTQVRWTCLPDPLMPLGACLACSPRRPAAPAPFDCKRGSVACCRCRVHRRPPHRAAPGSWPTAPQSALPCSGRPTELHICPSWQATRLSPDWHPPCRYCSVWTLSRTPPRKCITMSCAGDGSGTGCPLRSWRPLHRGDHEDAEHVAPASEPARPFHSQCQLGPHFHPGLCHTSAPALWAAPACKAADL